jgi:hypothetical protein
MLVWFGARSTNGTNRFGPSLLPTYDHTDLT